MFTNCEYDDNLTHFVRTGLFSWPFMCKVQLVMRELQVTIALDLTMKNDSSKLRLFVGTICNSFVVHHKTSNRKCSEANNGSFEFGAKIDF